MLEDRLRFGALLVEVEVFSSGLPGVGADKDRLFRAGIFNFNPERASSRVVDKLPMSSGRDNDLESI